MARRLKQYIDFSDSVHILASTNQGIEPTGTAEDENTIVFSNGEVLNQHIVGTQTILSPAMAATGLDVSQDNADNDGMELSGFSAYGNSLAFTIGTDDAFYFACQFNIPDVSGGDDIAVGFRPNAANNVDFNAYTDFACMNINGSGTTTNIIQIETRLNSGSVATTATADTWADTATKTLKVLVSSAGVVTYQIDGVAPTTTATFTFDDGDSVVPFFFYRNASDVLGAITIVTWDVGFQ